MTRISKRTYSFIGPPEMPLPFALDSNTPKVCAAPDCNNLMRRVRSVAKYCSQKCRTRHAAQRFVERRRNGNVTPLKPEIQAKRLENKQLKTPQPIPKLFYDDPKALNEVSFGRISRPPTILLRNASDVP